MNPEREHAEHGMSPGGANDPLDERAAARQDNVESLLARIFTRQRAALWRNSKERESEESDPDDPASCLWDVMPDVAKEFQVSGSSEPEWDDLSFY